MSRHPVELAAQRAVTRAFVDANFEDITLVPRVKAKTTTGGQVYAEQPPRPSQRFHIVERNSSAGTSTRVVGGTQHEEEILLIGYWDAQIGEHDIFTVRGAEWEVIKVEWDNGYERRARVIRYGR